MRASRGWRAEDVAHASSTGMQACRPSCTHASLGGETRSIGGSQSCMNKVLKEEGGGGGYGG